MLLQGLYPEDAREPCAASDSDSGSTCSGHHVALAQTPVEVVPFERESVFRAGGRRCPSLADHHEGHMGRVVEHAMRGKRKRNGSGGKGKGTADPSSGTDRHPLAWEGPEGRIRRHFGFDEATPIHWLGMQELLTCSAAHGIPLAMPGPGNKAEQVPLQLVQDVRARVTAEMELELLAPGVLRLVIGPMLAELMAWTGAAPAADVKVGEQAPSGALGAPYGPTRESADLSMGPKLVLYSAHDTTVLPLAVALGAAPADWPPYASSIVIEVWESVPGDGESGDMPGHARAKGQIYVRAILNGHVLRLRDCLLGENPMRREVRRAAREVAAKQSSEPKMRGSAGSLLVGPSSGSMGGLGAGLLDPWLSDPTLVTTKELRAVWQPLVPLDVATECVTGETARWLLARGAGRRVSKALREAKQG